MVSKFSHCLSNFNFLCLRIVKVGLIGNVTVGRLNLKHVLIQLSNEEDFSRIWLRGAWTFDSFHMRVFKWTPNFDPQIESSIAPVRIRLLDLPVHLFEKNALFTLASKIAKPLRMDELIADLSRPDLACVCVELDLTAPKVQVVYLNIKGKTYIHLVLYENYPAYCSSCNHLGHDISNCIVKHNNEKSQADVEPRPPGTSSNHNKETRDLREIINNKRKCKNVIIDNASATASIKNIVENGVQLHIENIDKFVVDDIEFNANAGVSLISHVLERESLTMLEKSQSSYTAMASPDDFNYEDPLIAELLDKDWDVEKPSRSMTHFINIDDVEGINNPREQYEISGQLQHEHIADNRTHEQ
ncbi:UNVERIFIED_CONTAM: hypothetical protein Sradi_4881100 [Sesamum radiatum]|uniref:DUF4283 domain-containing protein n=1 Tax=Sesamum radiatum TaxID=300843 RepID=A0AAW2MY79_SESRA